ncbi:MAG: hypothetical protein OXJ37_11170 [Bryobacterales bacterium]|nr:hypothetical protein [Bryobacterales bacterium]
MGSGLAEQFVEFRRLVRHSQQLQQLVFQSRLFELGQLALQCSCRFSFRQYQRKRKLANRTGFQYKHPPRTGYHPQERFQPARLFA